MASRDYNEEKDARGVHWGFKEVAATAILYGLSITCIVLGLQPIFTMDYELKSFANLLFVASHAFYMFSFTAVHRKSHFIFWSTSFLLLICTTLMFYFYDSLFL
jgi:hypothetical protein